ncbi:hypothetical protein PoB_000844900 [Plakobranchus ocellatus]|uniref:Uncharacterized protein n=1 Tax=Plakobranchus ocellatus TaxID=259542 RepID=A0AAV3YG19_9GAST|nr:hypothetical protein PoB_000844900 [Plakobranchus ocellatus]
MINHSCLDTDGHKELSPAEKSQVNEECKRLEAFSAFINPFELDDGNREMKTFRFELLLDQRSALNCIKYFPSIKTMPLETTLTTELTVFLRSSSSPLARTTGKNPACATGANTALKTRAGACQLCTRGTVAVIFKSDWSVQDFFSPGRARHGRVADGRIRVHNAHS